MSALLTLRALLFAGECLLASLLLPALAAALQPRRRAAMRHLVWLTMFGVLAMLPLAALLLPPRRIVEHVAAPVFVSVPQNANIMPASIMAAPPPPSFFTLENIALLLAALWLAGLCWHLLRMAVGAYGLMRLRRRSCVFEQAEAGCELRLSAETDGPSTFGILRPIVLLPQSALAWPAVRREAVLRHEMAHVRRHDAMTQMLARLVCALYWPNPLVWLAARALRQAAEHAADDAVLAAGMTPSLYAAELLGLAAEGGTAPGVAMAGSALGRRVQSVLATNPSRTGVTKMDMMKTLSFGLAATLLLGAARFDIAVAEDAPAPVRPGAVTIGPVPADPSAAAAVRAQIQAQAAATKAKADAVTAKAQTKAASEIDPSKKAQYAEEAAKVAAQSEQLKAQADAMAVEARRRLAEAQPRFAQMQQQATQMLGQAAQVRAQALQLAQAAPQSHDGASASSDAQGTTTINGVTVTGRSLRGAAQNDAAAQTLRALQTRLSADDARRQSQRVLASIGPEIEKAIADAHIQEAVAKALADAHIDEKIAKALADANLDAHDGRAINVTGVPRALTITPGLTITPNSSRLLRGNVTIAPAPPPAALPVPPVPAQLPPPPAN